MSFSRGSQNRAGPRLARFYEPRLNDNPLASCRKHTMSPPLLADVIWTNAGGRTVLHAMPLILGVLCVLAIAYRYYSAFLAAHVLRPER